MILSVDNLNYSISNKEILRNLNFELGSGEILALLGPSGVGKTTILNILAKFINPTSGSVKQNGEVFYLPQNAQLMPWRTALESALLPLEIKRRIGIASKNLALELFSKFGMQDETSTSSENLSGGMRQRVLLIQALLSEASIYLLDEPFSAIDVNQKVSIINCVRAILKEKNKAAILVTHSIDEALAIADSVYVLNHHNLVRLSDKIEEEFKSLRQVNQSKSYSIIKAKVWDLMM